MVVTALIVAGVAVVYMGVMIALAKIWRPPADEWSTGPAVRTPIDHDPDTRYPFMSGDIA
jgi:hypothetical protein